MLVYVIQKVLMIGNLWKFKHVRYTYKHLFVLVKLLTGKNGCTFGHIIHTIYSYAFHFTKSGMCVLPIHYFCAINTVPHVRRELEKKTSVLPNLPCLQCKMSVYLLKTKLAIFQVLKASFQCYVMLCSFLRGQTNVHCIFTVLYV